MRRREFLGLGLGTATCGSFGMGAEQPVTVTGNPIESDQSVPNLWKYSHEEHRWRLENVGLCNRSIRSFMRRNLITDYLPGQACYNLGEYPALVPWKVDEYDEAELDRLKEDGIQVLQVFDDWNDSLRLFGGDKYSAVNPEGYRRFIELAHRRQMRVLTYTSTGFLQRADPDFRQAWSREGDYLVLGYWDMARCSPASPGWRAFLLPRLLNIMDEYGSDGIYIDGGYLTNLHSGNSQVQLAQDEIPAFRESPEYDGAFADLLALIYEEVKRRGGILKLHVNAAEQPQSGGLKVYDYLWVGEGVSEVDSLREAVKDHSPYVVPCLDLSFATVETENEHFLHFIPYMQFPVLSAGRIFSGERGSIPGITYNEDYWTRRCRQIWSQYQKDPSSLYTYSIWDEFPGSYLTRGTHARWLKSYLPLVEGGTWAWLEIRESTLFHGSLPATIVASAFANRNLYLVLANYARTPFEIQTTHTYVDADERDARPSQNWTLAPRTLRILRYQA